MLPAGGNPIYYAEDLLGSSRVITTNTGAVCYDADFDPYGGEHPYTNTCPQNYKFEGKERDTETGNDDFGARYYTSRFGRWLSADWSSVPVPVPYANLTNPQTLNLYAMVSDDPESFADLDGHTSTQIYQLANPAASGVVSLAQGNYGTALLSFASAVPLIGNVGEAFKVAKLGEESVEGFKTFNSFKKFYGAPGEGMQWHHIVEQGGGRVARFGPEAIHNAENLVQIPTEVHRQISGFYSSVQKGISEGKTVRQWLKTKSFEEQYEFGKTVTRRFSVN